MCYTYFRVPVLLVLPMFSPLLAPGLLPAPVLFMLPTQFCGSFVHSFITTVSMTLIYSGRSLVQLPQLSLLICCVVWPRGFGAWCDSGDRAAPMFLIVDFVHHRYHDHAGAFAAFLFQFNLFGFTQCSLLCVVARLCVSMDRSVDETVIPQARLTPYFPESLFCYLAS